MARAKSKRAYRRSPTPFQTVGPFFSPDLCPPEARDLTEGPGGRAKGERVYIFGKVFEVGGGPVPDAIVEMWQADAKGSFGHPAEARRTRRDRNFSGFGRAVTDARGRYSFLTIKPGAYPLPKSNLWRPPHINFAVYAAGVTRRLVTVMFFPGEPFNDTDPALAVVSGRARRARLVAKPAKAPRPRAPMPTPSTSSSRAGARRRSSRSEGPQSIRLSSRYMTLWRVSLIHVSMASSSM